VATATSINGTSIPSSKTLVATDSTAYVVPSQSGNTGKFLKTDGTVSSWAAVDALPSQTGNSGKFLTTDGSTSSWGAVAGALAQPNEPSSPSDGQIWIDTDGTAPTTVVTRWTEQPAAGTTVLTGNDDYSIPLAYSPGYEQVFLNGVLLSRSGSEYTATNGTSITLASATVAGDIVEVICPLQIATTDTYTQSAVNAAFQANTNNFAAGKNKIINGDMSIWQRGTSYNATAVSSYGAADRYSYYQNGSTAGTNTISRQTFTPGTAPVAGYEGQYFQRWTATTLGTSQTLVSFEQAIENVQTFAGQTATISFWAKSSAAFTTDVVLRQNFGSGGSTSVDTNTSTSTTSTSWTRFTFTVSVPSISGKTIGTSSHLKIAPRFYTITAGATVDIWGLQMESGSTATAFQTATGTIQGELAACQRYYWRTTSTGAAYQLLTGFGSGISTNAAMITLPVPVTMRINPSSVDFSTLALSPDNSAVLAVTNVTIGTGNGNAINVQATATGLLTQYRPYQMIANNSTAAFIGVSAEL
jgi:hypothetical protein